MKPSLDILLVDDDLGCLGCLEDFLEEEGHRIATATRGREALELVRKRLATGEGPAFELSILDIHVPDMTGLETFSELRLDLPELRAIFVSGAAEPSLRNDVREIGGLALLDKPLDLCRIRAEIERCRGGRN